MRVVAATATFTTDLITVDLEIELTNLLPQAAEGLRPVLALISASPEQDQRSAAFHAGPPPQSMGGTIDLAPGARVSVPARLSLPREQLHVVALGGRPMFVAMLLCDLRWRSGLSVRRLGADFLLGAAGQGVRPGPIWLDRPAPRTLAAIAYQPASAKQA